MKFYQYEDLHYILELLSVGYLWRSYSLQFGFVISTEILQIDKTTGQSVCGTLREYYCGALSYRLCCNDTLTTRLRLRVVSEGG